MKKQKEQQPINVTDHAVIRWMERYYGLDIDALRDHIAQLVEDAMDLGATKVTYEGYAFVLNPTHRAVCTVLAPGMKPSNLSTGQMVWSHNIQEEVA